MCVFVWERERESLTFAPPLSFIEHDDDDNKSLNCHVFVATEKKDDYDKIFFMMLA